MKVKGRSSISSSRWRDDWLTEAEVVVFQLGAQGFHLHVGFGLDLAGLHLEVFQLLGALILQLVLQGFQFLLRRSSAPG